MWAGRGRVDSTQASAREIGVQACWRSCTSFAKKTQIYKKKFSNFFFSSFSLQVSLSPAYSASISPFQVCLSLTFRFTAPVLCLSGHCRLPADSLWIRPRFCALLDHCQLPADMFFLVSCHPGHCRLPADLLWFRPRYCAIQTTVSSPADSVESSQRAEVGFEPLPLP